MLASLPRLAGLVPGWAWLALALLAWGGWQRHQAREQTAAAEQARTSGVLAAARAQAEADARALEHTLTTNARKAADEQARRLARTRAAAADTAAELERLRHAMAATGPAAGDPGADPSACRRADETAATYRQLFGACAGQLAGMGRDAEDLADQVAGLQGYVRAVVPSVGQAAPADAAASNPTTERTPPR